MCESLTPWPMGGSRRPIIGVTRLALLAYFAVSAGPFGIEDAVGSAGALPTLLGILVVAVAWGLTQGLMTAELSSLVPCSGGYVLWVSSSLGPLWGHVNAWNAALCNVFDLALYPVLFSCYSADLARATFWPGFHPSAAALWAAKAGVLVLGATMNLRAVGSLSALLSVALLLPFMFEVPWAVMEAGHHGISVWSTTALDCPACPRESHARGIDWATLISTLVWCFSGWDSLGSFAGEVSRPEHTYPRGIALGLVLITITYLVPVMVGLLVLPDTSRWAAAECDTLAGVAQHATRHAASPNASTRCLDEEGPFSLVSAARCFGYSYGGSGWSGWLPTWLALAATASALGQFNVNLASSSRALACMASSECGMLPAVLRDNNGEGGGEDETPVRATLLLLLAVGVLTTFEFRVLLKLDTFLNSVSLALEFAAFLYLKAVAPDAPRPYEVPGGMLGAVAITVPKFLLLTATVMTQDGQSWLFCVGTNIIVVGTFFVRVWCCPTAADRRHRTPSSVHDKPTRCTAGRWCRPVPPEEMQLSYRAVCDRDGQDPEHALMLPPNFK